MFRLILIVLLTASIALAQPRGFSIPESQNQLVKLSDQGIEPKQLSMKLEDSIAFFLNDSREALTTVEVDYSGKKTHCATANMKIDENQRARSVRPYGPRDFASVCFHEKGEYPFVVYGLPSNPQGIKGTISVR